MPEKMENDVNRIYVPQRSSREEHSDRQRSTDLQGSAAKEWLRRYDRLGASLGLRGGLLLLADVIALVSLFVIAGTQPFYTDFWGLASIFLFVLAVLLLGLSVVLAGGVILPDWKFRLPGLAGEPPDPDPPVFAEAEVDPCFRTQIDDLQEINNAVKRARGMYQLQQRFLSLGLLSLLVALGIITLLALILWIV